MPPVGRDCIDDWIDVESINLAPTFARKAGKVRGSASENGTQGAGAETLCDKDIDSLTGEDLLQSQYYDSKDQPK